MLGLAGDVQAVAWARVYAALKPEYSKGLRHGVWYAVIDDGLPDRVTLQLGPRAAAVPRRLLELRTERPEHFSIVYRLDKPAPERVRFGQGKRYLACPHCDFRHTIVGHPDRNTCVTCGHSAEVAWWEA